MLDIKVIERKTYKGGAEIFIHTMQKPGGIATLAGEFCCRWGMVAAKDDGEDSAGRQRVKTLTPSEVVSRACEMASLLWAEFEQRGWLLTVPEPKEPQEK